MATRPTSDDAQTESGRIGPDDPRYRAVVDKRFNKRFRASPDYVRLVSSTDQVIAAVEEAVSEERRLVVTSGGHCLEGFVSDPSVRVIVDVSPMKRIHYDDAMGAVAVEAGATVGETFRDALLKKRLTDRQMGVAHDYLTRADHDVMGGMLGFATYGGRINDVAADATASAQRDAILDIACNTGWLDPREEARNLAWVRAFYRDLFVESGGVPVPGDAYSGALINHPDTDLTDPALNTSGVPWHAIYYNANYSRLQRVKARWDPRNVFRHALSIRGE